MASTRKLKTKRLLHLDDDPFELDLVRSTLAQELFDETLSLVSVGNSQDYKKQFEQCAPDVVILDIDIGEGRVTGIDIAEYTREASSDILIIFRSSTRSSEVIECCMKAGRHRFFLKSTNRHELLQLQRLVNSW